MGWSKLQTSTSRLMNLLAEWDKGSKPLRANILKDFIAENQNKTGPELEEEFAQAASLFLTRLTAWLRTSYMVGTCLDLQLRAIQIFLTASSGNRFLLEVIEVGGVLTFLEIIGLKQAKEEHKALALDCLQSIASAGRKYKEMICESYGIRSLAECLATSTCELTQDKCRSTLLSLADGNSKFEQQVYKGLIALLHCSSPKAQQMTCKALRQLQPKIGPANLTIIEPLMSLLKTLHLEVQYEAIELIKDLIQYRDVKEGIASGLVSLLIPSREEIIARHEILEDASVEVIGTPLPYFIQQAAAAKTIGIIVRECSEMSDCFVRLRIVHGLMHAMGNQDYADSQRQASLTLEWFCHNIPAVDDQAREAMGKSLYELFMSNPEKLYVNMDHIQADVLISNKVEVIEGARLAKS